MNGRTQVIRYNVINHCMESYSPKRKKQNKTLKALLLQYQLIYLNLFRWFLKGYIELSKYSMYNKSNKWVGEVKRMWIGIAILAFALPIGLFLVADLLREQHRTSSQDNRSSYIVIRNRQGWYGLCPFSNLMKKRRERCYTKEKIVSGNEHARRKTRFKKRNHIVH